MHARKTRSLNRSGTANKHAASKAPTSDTQAEMTGEGTNNHYETNSENQVPSFCPHPYTCKITYTAGFNYRLLIA